MNGNKIYVVTREGVYRHEILGIFDKRHLAELAADEISQSEGDDYHYITVNEAPINQKIEDVDPVVHFQYGKKPEKVA